MVSFFFFLTEASFAASEILSTLEVQKFQAMFLERKGRQQVLFVKGTVFFLEWQSVAKQIFCSPTIWKVLVVFRSKDVFFFSLDYWAFLEVWKIHWSGIRNPLLWNPESKFFFSSRPLRIHRTLDTYLLRFGKGFFFHNLVVFSSRFAHIFLRKRQYWLR